MLFAVLMTLAAGPVKVALTAPTAVGLEPVLVDVVADRLASQLAADGRLRLTTARDMAQVLGLERQRQLLGCSETSCLAEIGAALGVDVLLSMSLAKTEKSVSISLRALRTSDGTAVAQETHRAKDMDEVQDWLDGIVAPLANRIATPFGVAPIEVRAAAPSGSAAPWVVGVGGLALALGGGVMLGVSVANGESIRTAPTTTEVDRLVDTAQTTRWVGVGLLVGAGVAVAAAVVWWLVQPKRTPVSLSALSNSAWGFSW